MDNIVAAKMLVEMVADVNKYGVSQDGYNEAVALACAALLSGKNNEVTVMRCETEEERFVKRLAEANRKTTSEAERRE